MSKKQKIRELRSKDSNYNKINGEKKKMNTNTKRCSYCGSEMKIRKCGDSAGGISWKCRNKKCGRTVWEHRKVTPPVPLVPMSLNKYLY